MRFRRIFLSFPSPCIRFILRSLLPNSSRVSHDVLVGSYNESSDDTVIPYPSALEYNTKPYLFDIKNYLNKIKANRNFLGIRNIPFTRRFPTTRMNMVTRRIVNLSPHGWRK